MRRAAPVRVSLRRSWLAAAWVALLHGLSASLVVLLPLAVAAQALLLALILVSVAWHLRAQLFPSAKSLILFPDHRLHLERRSGATLEATALPASVVLPWLVILRYRLAGDWRSRSLLLLPDSCSAEERRLLRIALRWRRPDTDLSAS